MRHEDECSDHNGDGRSDENRSGGEIFRVADGGVELAGDRVAEPFEGGVQDLCDPYKADRCDECRPRKSRDLEKCPSGDDCECRREVEPGVMLRSEKDSQATGRE